MKTLKDYWKIVRNTPLNKTGMVLFLIGLYWCVFYYLALWFNNFLGAYLEIHASNVQQFIADKLGVMILLLIFSILVPYAIYTVMKFFLLKQFGKLSWDRLTSFFLLNLKLLGCFLLIALVWNFLIYGLQAKALLYAFAITGPLLLFFVNMVIHRAHFGFLHHDKNLVTRGFRFLGEYKKWLWILVADALILLVGAALMIFVGKLYFEPQAGGVLASQVLLAYVKFFRIGVLLLLLVIMTLNTLIMNKLIHKH